MKSKPVLILVAVSLLLGGYASGDRVVEGQDLPADTRVVLTAEQARSWAQAWVRRKQGAFPEWEGAMVSDPTLYYDLDGYPAVYVFSVLQDRRDVGHVVINYQALDNPVLVFGKGVTPHLRCPNCLDGAALAGQGLKLAAKNLVYLGPLDYFYKVERLKGLPGPSASDEGVQKLIPMGTSKPIAVSYQSAGKTWIDVPLDTLPDLSAVGTAAASTSKIIYGVPDYDQFIGSDYGYPYPCASGCTPTAAANIVHFWDKAGYDGFAYDGWRDTTYHMRNYMETWCEGYSGSTWSHKTSPGMVQYAQSRGQSFTSQQYCWPGTNWLGCVGDASWSLYTSEIDQGHPVLISLNTSTYGSHSVTGVGYDTDGGEFWIVHDNWPSTPEDVYVSTASSSHRFYHPLIPPYLDTISPNTMVLVPRYHQKDTPVLVQWQGHDNFSGIARYDMHYRQVGQDWVEHFDSTTETEFYMYGESGKTYSFRSRSYDWLGNISSWAKSRCTFYQYQAAGWVTGNRGYAVLGAEVTATPEALNTAVPGPEAEFGLYFAASSTVTLTVSAAKYGALPPMKNLVVDRDHSDLHFVLPPPDEAIDNGHFEEGLSSWQASSTFTPTVVTETAHTGDQALQIDVSGGLTATVWHISQTVGTAVTTDEPTLSWFYAVSGTASAEDRLWIKVESSSGTPGDALTVTLPLSVTGWTHHWLSLEPFAGEPVTVTFGLSKSESTPVITVLLDEVSLGQGNKEPFGLFLPLVTKNW